MPTSSTADMDGSFVIVDDESRPSRSKTIELPYAHNWAPHHKLSLHGRHFVDKQGRVCLLRGVNLSGNCKSPVNGNHDTFPANAQSVTFVGRPFSLEDAPVHFARLRRWGFSFIRFLVTWEAMEHEGPGIYDQEYLDYIRALLAMLPSYGLSAFVALHQDVWSRYSGGSGAPAWTMEAVGFKIDAAVIEETQAAWLTGVRGGGHKPEERGLWPCGYQKLAAATMATCFWAGDTFAPKLKVKNQHGEEVSIQTFLQGTFLDMWATLAKNVGDLPGVLGFEIMNEPHRGYIELQSMHRFDYNTDLHLGYIPTALESFTLGSGHPTEVGYWTRSFPFPTRLTSRTLLNTSKQKVWRDDGPTEGKCLWEMHGVWGWDLRKEEGVVLRESYFKKHPMTGKKVDWYTDFYYPFLNQWADRVRKVSNPEKIVFVEPIPNEFCPESWTAEHQVSNMVYAPHWYDLKSLFEKSFGDFTVNVQELSRGAFLPKTFYWGQKGARNNFFRQIRNIIEAGYRSLGEKPVIIGETGVPMDMNNGYAFETDRWTFQSRMMDAILTGLERSLVGFTLWNYNPDNDDQKGDDWNGENFSWFSNRRALPASLLDLRQTAPGLDSGSRILRSVVRPYPAKTAGIPLKFSYEPNTGEFTYAWVVPHSGGVQGGQIDASISSPPEYGHPTLKSATTEIYIPSFLATGSKVVVHGLAPTDKHHYEESLQTLFIVSGDQTPGRKVEIRVTLAPALKAVFEVNDVWSDWGGQIITVAMALVAVFVYVLMRIIF
ncbi:glycoside hydrolase family 5 protein [Cristinia sonorae]|uniref:Glycoside hydrolase family 5 protein n=1 Tax=Cristinia sonorae TaxID=1940300 RepID=A0A8K0UUM3_9AGAR|nr:glycoside hydrolase family 5 protein [Cristinia sonorae]